jgi:hypothetical protein
MGGEDHTVPEAITKSTLKQYRHSPAVTDIMEFLGPLAVRQPGPVRRSLTVRHDGPPPEVD